MGPSAATFKNKDRVRVQIAADGAAGSVTHLRTGRSFPLESFDEALAAGSVSRARLKGIGERAGERIDLSAHGDPALPRCVFVNVAAPTTVLDALEQLSALPTSPSAEAERRKLFRAIDSNSNGFVSLSELDLGLRNELRLGEPLLRAKPAILRAFQAAKGARVSRQQLGADMVESGEEFRLLLLYLQRYFELFGLFEQIDTSGDRRLDLDEFEEALPLLAGWGVAVADPAREFAAIDLDGGGKVLFDEFAQ